MRASATYFKYLYYFLHCGSLKKFANFILNKAEKKAKKTHLKSFPVDVMIDPCTICDLHCPGCEVGVKYPSLIEPQKLSFEDFKHIFDQVKDYVFNISLYCLGEPFLNQDIFRMVEYASLNKCGTTIHSNFNSFSEEMAEKAIKSRLTHIYLSIDGATQEIYERYRVEGNLNRILKNIEIIISMKKKLKSIFPLLTWKYLIFPYNAHEIDLARKKAKSLGVDAFEVFNANLKNLSTFGMVKHYDLTTGNIKTLTGNFCDSLWSSTVIYPDGSVFPCCKSFRKKDSFGNIYAEPFRKIWNNGSFSSARRSMRRVKVDSNLGYPCLECEIIEKIKNRNKTVKRNG